MGSETFTADDYRSMAELAVVAKRTPYGVVKDDEKTRRLRLMLIRAADAIAAGRPALRHEYCSQFRQKGSDDAWAVINWSVGTLRRAREALKVMLKDWTYRQYEYRVATRLTSDWRAK